MSTIYCSTKLSTLLGLPKKPKDHIIPAADPHSWNAMLFYLNKRKCLLFTHKTTLYTVVVLDILKKDLANFPKFFRVHLTDQLLADQILNTRSISILGSYYESITLHSTDNDRKVIGSINEFIAQIRVYDYMRKDTFLLNPTNFGHELNRTPMGAIGYAFPLEKMKEFFKKL
jgi:hypothetical protein